MKSLLIAAQNNAIRANYIKAKIDNTQNNKFWLCGVRDESVNHMISEYGRLPPKEYETKHEWVGKVIH